VDSTRWQRIKEILAASLAHPPGERRAFFDEACGGDGELRSEIESLLAGEEQLEGFLVEPIFRLQDGGDDGPVPGQRIGHYRLLTELGRGGMGRVYLALRDDEEFEQQVALKVLKRGLDTDEILDRFRRERQILARLEHPNIAHLLDGGTTDDGLPYFVMEHVEGRPIDLYCDTEGLSINERLALFLTVCGAVQFAHQSLVVHRDLKPGNILVTADGVPKLLDFGIAKLLSREQEEIALTRAGWEFFTPECASPEQIRGEAVTTASDVFSLGILLYLLLSGHRPFPVGASSRRELEQALAETEPEPPSRAAGLPPRGVAPGRSESGGEAPSPEEIAHRRGLDPSRLRRRLEGDLDAITLKTLEKDPRDRYASVAALVEDLRRYRMGLPVEASAHTFWYRAEKFFQRHRKGMVITALAISALLLFTATTALLWRNAERQRDRAELERERSENLMNMLEDSFQTADPLQDGELRARTPQQILDKGRNMVSESAGAPPEDQARLLLSLARIYRNLGNYPEAWELAEQALHLREGVYGDDDVSVAESLHLLGFIALEEGEPEHAEPYLRRALGIQRREYGDAHPEVARALNNLASCLIEQGKYAEAEGPLRQALGIKEHLFGREHLEVATILHNLGRVHLALENLGEAEAFYREALELRRRLVPPGSHELAFTLNGLASVLERRGRLEEAGDLYAEALEIRRQLYPEGHKDTAVVLNNLARLRQAQGDLRAATELFTEALAISPEVLSRDHPIRAGILRNAAALDAEAARPEACEEHAREALEVYQGLHGEGGHWRVADAESVLGGCLLLPRRFAEAEVLLLDAREGLAGLSGRSARYRREALERLVKLYEAWGKSAEAAPFREELGGMEGGGMEGGAGGSR